jgi:hypothetical protein
MKIVNQTRKFKKTLYLCPYSTNNNLKISEAKVFFFNLTGKNRQYMIIIGLIHLSQKLKSSLGPNISTSGKDR